MSDTQSNVEIATFRCTDGTYSWNFNYNGVMYFEHDFTTREAAISDAKSFARIIHRRFLNAVERNGGKGVSLKEISATEAEANWKLERVQ